MLSVGYPYTQSFREKMWLNAEISLGIAGPCLETFRRGLLLSAEVGGAGIRETQVQKSPARVLIFFRKPRKNFSWLNINALVVHPDCGFAGSDHCISSRMSVTPSRDARVCRFRCFRPDVFTFGSLGRVASIRISLGNESYAR